MASALKKIPPDKGLEPTMTVKKLVSAHCFNHSAKLPRKSMVIIAYIYQESIQYDYRMSKTSR